MAHPFDAGIAAAIKVTPGLFAIHLLFARKWRAAWGVILTAGVATVGTALRSARVSPETFKTAKAMASTHCTPMSHANIRSVRTRSSF